MDIILESKLVNVKDLKPNSYITSIKDGTWNCAFFV